MIIRNLPAGKGRPARKADNLTAICLENVEASTSHNSMGPPWPLTGIALRFLPLSYLSYDDYYFG
jgi:hypothetical protein